ncbi:MAG: HD domain-containing protein [Bacteroidetes bacterium]|nr:HD domain-containing protein [Bacteroidota bacterium]
MEEIEKIYQLIHLAEKLKFELRHSSTSTGRKESVAEHTWRMALMGLLTAKKLDKQIDTEKLLKMILIHDLVEAEAGDTPVPFMLNNEDVKKEKEKKERAAIAHIRSLLNNEIGEEIFSLWNEFEECETYEAKTANALDKLEAQIQHNEADISTWIPVEYELIYSRRKYTAFDSFLDKFRAMVEEESETKLRNYGIDVDAVKRKLNLET